MTHLTEEQIDELLMGSLSASEAAQMREHAAGCEACAAQLAEIETPLTSFKAVTLAWSERRSATMPVQPASGRARSRLGLAFAWGSLAAAALLAAVIPVLRHEQNVRVQEAYRKAITLPNAAQQPATTVPATSANAASTQNDSADTAVPENAQEIATDNRMLAMVDEELNAPIGTPGSRGRHATPGRGHTQTNTPEAVRD